MPIGELTGEPLWAAPPCPSGTALYNGMVNVERWGSRKAHAVRLVLERALL